MALLIELNFYILRFKSMPSLYDRVWQVVEAVTGLTQKIDHRRQHLKKS
jgi:hypothetical protein